MIDTDADARRRRLAAAVDAAVGTSPTARLCAAAAETLVAGAGLSLMSDGAQTGTLCSTEGAQRGEELQITLGEGPCLDAHTSGRVVAAPDLVSDSTWLAFGPAADEAGIAAAFAFPLQAGAVRIGTLNLYRDQAGALGDEQFADALVLANLALQMILNLQAQAPADELPDLLAHENVTGWELHQATGMVATQLAISIDEAAIRLRGHAFATDRPLGEVAADVVARRVRLED